MQPVWINSALIFCRPSLDQTPNFSIFFLEICLLTNWVQIGFPYWKQKLRPTYFDLAIWWMMVLNRSVTRPWRIWPDSLDNQRCILWALPSGMTEVAWGSQSGWTAWHQQSWAPASNKNEFIVDSDFKCWTEDPFSGRLNFASSVACRLLLNLVIAILKQYAFISLLR